MSGVLTERIRDHLAISVRVFVAVLERGNCFNDVFGPQVLANEGLEVIEFASPPVCVTAQRLDPPG